MSERKRRISDKLIQISGPKRALKLSYRALVRCKRIATTSPIQWRQRELPGGARKQSQNTSKSKPKSKNIFRGGSGGRSPPEGSSIPPFQAAESSSGGRLLKEFLGGIFTKLSPASRAEVGIFIFIECPPPLPVTGSINHLSIPTSCGDSVIAWLLLPRTTRRYYREIF